jgi:hypothetical protein
MGTGTAGPRHVCRWDLGALSSTVLSTTKHLRSAQWVSGLAKGLLRSALELGFTAFTQSKKCNLYFAQASYM